MTLASARARWDELEKALKEKDHDKMDDDEFITVMRDHLAAIEDAKKLVNKLEKKHTKRPNDNELHFFSRVKTESRERT